MWPQLMCCALALKNLVSVNFRLRRKEESCGAEVVWCGSKCGAKGIKVRSKVDQNADQNAEQGGAKDMCFYLIPNWSLALRQAH